MTYSKKPKLFRLSFERGWCQNARHQPSSNYNQRPENCQINSIIIHGISLPRGVFSGNDIDDLFCNRLDCSKDPSYQDLENLKVSAHFLVRRDGELVQYVSIFDRAWHAGKSSLYGEENCNHFSIGIELEGVDNIAYTKAQYQKLADLVATLKQDFPAITQQRIVGHSDVAPGRKTDPGEAFLWDKFFFRLNQAEQSNMKSVSGYIRKLKTHLDQPVNYFLTLHDTNEIHEVHLNPLIGQMIKIENLNEIACVACGRLTKKSFAQGYCYPCFSRLPECDLCIMSPEKCHYQAGTCRDPDWGDKHCMQEHYVYLASSSSVKVGITRASQIPTRWIDQGAVTALPIARVSQRYYSGLLEVIFKQHVSDRTSWQKMLKTQHSLVDLEQTRDHLFHSCLYELNQLQQHKSNQEIELLANEKVVSIDYPVQHYPSKVTSINLEKNNMLEARLIGIKGQYLIFDIGVINIRKYSGYLLRFSFE